MNFCLLLLDYNAILPKNMKELTYGKMNCFQHLQFICKPEDSGNNSKYLVTKNNIENKLMSMLRKTLPFSQQAKHNHWLLN